MTERPVHGASVAATVGTIATGFPQWKAHALAVSMAEPPPTPQTTSMESSSTIFSMRAISPSDEMPPKVSNLA